MILTNERWKIVFELKNNTGLVFVISRNNSAEPAVCCDYSDFCCFSKAVPWQLLRCCFKNISCVQHDSAVVVEAECEDFLIRDHFSFYGSCLRISRSWTILADQNSIVLGTGFRAGSGVKEKITLPGVLYNDNPAADPERLVPHLPGTVDGALIVEEHRLPIPGINIEYADDDAFSALTLFSLPSETPAGENWSMGLRKCADGRFELLCLSGAVSFDDKRDHLYGTQCKLSHLPGFGYLDLKKNDEIRKTLYLDLACDLAEGRGFTALVEKGMELYQPQENPVLSCKEMIALKLNALENRWLETPHGSGFCWILDGVENGNVYGAKSGFLFGWVGQSLRLARCALQLGLEGDEKWMKRGIAVLENFVSAPDAEGVPGLKYLFMDHESGEWSNGEHRGKNKFWSRLAGESLANLAHCLNLLKKHRYPVKIQWEETLKRGADFLLSPASLNKKGCYPQAFAADGSPMDDDVNGAGTACVEALILASLYFEDPELKTKALQMLDLYNDLFLKTLENPFSRATLDASCEDKESGIYFFLAAYQAYCSTGDAKYEEYAKTSALWISTFVYLWSVSWQPGSICDVQGFDSVFWPGVSAQNMHLDVYFPAYEVCDFGKRTGNDVLYRIGHGVMSAWSHGICRFPGDWNFTVPGEQGEQFFQTNFYQGRFDEKAWRGGANVWNPVWIIALVLDAALKFRKRS